MTPTFYHWSRDDVVPDNFFAGLKLGWFALCLLEQVSLHFCVLLRCNPKSLVNNPNFEKEDVSWHLVQELNKQFSRTIILDPRILTNIGNQIWTVQITRRYKEVQSSIPDIHKPQKSWQTTIHNDTYNNVDDNGIHQFDTNCCVKSLF